MIDGWKQEEISNLIKTVENFKNKNKPLLDAFFEHANKHNRKIFSVRNFYYKNIEIIKNDENLQKKLKINLKLHEKNNFAKFDERQTQKLIDYINSKKQEGKSVRKACQELAGNNATLMVRYQNKYRSMQKKDNTKNINTSNIISFPVEKKLQPQKLTDDEIKSLFLGLVNLVKKSTYQEAAESFLKEKQSNDMIFKKSIIEISQKDKKIEELMAENKKLTSKILMLKTKLENLRATTIETL